MPKGFTIIEVVLVIVISVFIFLFVFGAGSDFYASSFLTAERNSAVGLLRRARIKAMNNINQSDHGFYIGSNNYIVFQGDSYASRVADFDEDFPRSPGLTISGPAEIVFAAIEGSSNSSGTISLSSPSGKADISVNYKGRITW